MPKIFALLFIAVPVMPWFGAACAFGAGYCVATGKYSDGIVMGMLSIAITMFSSFLSQKMVDFVAE